MNVGHLLLLGILPLSISASGQDWQHCKPDGAYSFAELKDSVRRVTTMHGYTGWDDKAFSRAGDMAAVAIVQTLSDSEITSPDTMKDVLIILRLAFGCPARCVTARGDRQPNVTMLLIEHLQNRDSGGMQPKIDETRKFILQQTRDVE
jgi:hypothetical protein